MTLPICLSTLSPTLIILLHGWRHWLEPKCPTAWKFTFCIMPILRNDSGLLLTVKDTVQRLYVIPNSCRRPARYGLFLFLVKLQPVAYHLHPFQFNTDHPSPKWPILCRVGRYSSIQYHTTPPTTLQLYYYCTRCGQYFMAISLGSPECFTGTVLQELLQVATGDGELWNLCKSYVGLPMSACQVR